MFSIYSSFFNLQSSGFPWKDTLKNWLSFLNGGDQISLAINTSTDDTPKLVRDWVEKWQLENPISRVTVTITETAIPYEDPLFDGKIKAAALAACTQPFAILLDCDEVVIPDQYSKWVKLSRDLEMNAFLDAFLIPVVDIIKDDQHWKSVGTKWYLHKNRPEITRGVVKQARLEDGSISTDHSDTCELIFKETGELVRSAPVMAPLPPWMAMSQLESGEIPFVVHLGWRDFTQRLKQSAFWRDVWTARRGGRDPEPEMTWEKLEAIPRYKHRLPRWSNDPIQLMKQEGELWTRYR